MEECLADIFANKWDMEQKIVALKSMIDNENSRMIAAG
jgi:hypothetical protein